MTIWEDFFPGVFATVDGSANIEAARLPENALSLYKGVTASHSASYAQIKFWSPVGYETNFNVDLFARWHFSGAQLRGYDLKYFNGQLGASVPTIVILRVGEGDTDNDGTPDTIPPGASVQVCTSAPPFSTPGPKDRTKGVWQQIFVEDVNDQGDIYPVIKGKIGWGCTGGGSDGTAFANCSTVCEVTRNDIGDEDGNVGKLGAWSIWVHHHEHFIDAFEAGSFVP